MTLPKSEDVSISRIVELIENGEYRIPRFQRDFVWERKKSAALIDSIFHGYPIGSIIVWEAKSKLSCIDKKDLGGIKIVGKDTGRYTSYIIDGQQRLTSLFMAVTGRTTGKGQDFSQICVSLIAKGDEQIVYDSLPRDAKKSDYVSLKDLFTGDALRGKYYEKRLEYYDIIRQYKVSVINIDDTALALEQVVEVFERLNLGGKKLNMFSIVAARCYQPETDDEPAFDLANKLDELNQDLKESNYGAIAGATLLQVISACLIGKVQKADILKKLKDNAIRDNYDEIEQSIREAIEHLKGRSYGVAVCGLLPYERLLVPFAFFHYHHKKKNITAMQETYLQDYFWRCVISKRYNNAADANMNSDLQKIKDILHGKKPEQISISLLSPKFIFENGKFTLSSSFVLGMLCLMAQKSPQSFSVGRMIEITNASVSKSAEKQYHHFFPKQSEVIQNCPEYKQDVNNVVNIVFMDAITNNKIKNQNPSKYIRQFERNAKNFSSKLRSHYIKKRDFGLEDDNYFQFLNARSEALFLRLKELIVYDKKHDTVVDSDYPFE